MKKNSKGMTLVEVIIAMAILSVIISVMYSVYISNTKSISKTEIKDILQTESQYIQGTLSYIGMQSKGINDMLIDSNNEVDFLEFKMLSSKESNNRIYKLVLIPNIADDNKELVLNEYIDNVSDPISESTLSKNIKSFKVDFIGGNQTEAESISLNIILAKQKGFADITYPISTMINFRNK